MQALRAVPVAGQTDTNRDVPVPRRRGLAPMEFVLSLPVLLFTMALMINFGVIATWKVRALNATRLAMWRERSLYNGRQDPRPPYWPQTANMAMTGDSNLQTVNRFWDVSPITHPFARGPIVSGQSPYGTSGMIRMRDRRLLEMDEGMGRGVSQFTHPYALLPTLGSFRFELQHSLLDSRWQFQSMGYGDNASRRAQGWYIFESGPEWANEQARFLQADHAILGYSQRENLRPLDRDEEFPYYGHGSPDFYAVLSGCQPRRPECGECQINPQIVYLTTINPPRGSGLVQRIAGQTGGGRGGIPDRMADAWIQMYQQEIQRLMGQMPPNQAEIDRLTQEIEKLQAFKSTLS